MDYRMDVLDNQQETPTLASMARDDSPASNMAAAAARRPMRGKVGSEFDT